MPNWCNNTWKVTGDKTELTKLYNTLEEISNLESPLVENGFGKLWLGCLVTKLGGDWGKISCRGEITYYGWDEGNPNVLEIDSYSAWSEPTETRKFLQEKFPNINITYQSEEGGCDYYVTNDKDGTYFERYFFDSDQESLYFQTIEEACKYIKDLTGNDVKTVKDIHTAIEEYKKAHPNEFEWANFHEFEVTDD